MAKVVCNMNCKHRSKHPMRKYRKKDGSKCYGCTLDAISISRIFDPDNYVIQVIGEQDMARCSHYEPKEVEMLKRIMEEMSREIAGSMGKKREGLLIAHDIIRKHMNDGWIPCEERLPEVPNGTDDID